MTVRVCPKRDTACPYGMDCPFTIDQYHCRDEPSLSAQAWAMKDDLIERLEDDVHLQISWEDSPRYMVETYFRDRVEAAQALKAKDDEIARLKESLTLAEQAAVSAVEPLEAISLMGSHRYGPDIEAAICKGIRAVRLMAARRARTALGDSDE